jgi:hypothetical protein
MATASGSLAASADTVVLTKPQTDTIAVFEISGTYTTVTFVFEGNLTGTTYKPLAAVQADTGASANGTIAPTNSTSRIWNVPCLGCTNVRMRCTALATGSVNVNAVSLAPEGAALLGTAGSASSIATSSILTFPITLALVADGDILTEYTPGFAGRITNVDFAVTTKVSTGSKLSTLNMEIGTTNLTGGVVALTSANCATLGVMVEGTSVTGNNAFTATDAISIEASSTTAFSEGAGVLLVTIQNA